MTPHRRPLSRAFLGVPPGLAFKGLWALALLVAAAGVLWLGATGARALVPALVARVQALGPGAVPLYGAVYFVATLLLLPVSPLTVGAGFLFGWLPGALLGAAASVSASSAALVVGRTFGRALALKLSRRVPHFDKLSAALDRRGLAIILLLRVSPLVPFPILNYALGLTRLRVRTFALASLLGMAPGHFFFAWLGAQAPSFARLLERPALPPAATAATLVGFVSLGAVAIWVAGRQLARELK